MMVEMMVVGERVGKRVKSADGLLILHEMFELLGIWSAVDPCKSHFSL